MGKCFEIIIERISKLMHGIAGVALVFMIFLTACDVILRLFIRPIIGTYELVSYSGAIVIAFGIPFTSWIKGHVSVEFLISKFPDMRKNVVNFITRLMSIALFIVLGHNLLKMGVDYYKSGEVSATMHLPFYIVAYGMGICCFIQCLVLGCDILKIFEGRYE